MSMGVKIQAQLESEMLVHKLLRDYKLIPGYILVFGLWKSPLNKQESSKVQALTSQTKSTRFRREASSLQAADSSARALLRAP